MLVISLNKVKLFFKMYLFYSTLFLFCLISLYFILPGPIYLLIHIIQELVSRPPPAGASLHFTGWTDAVFHSSVLTSL